MGCGSVKFGIPWPTSDKPLQSISTSFDGRPNDDIALNGNIQLLNIASSTMATAQSSTESGGDASRAVDGDISNNAGASNANDVFAVADIAYAAGSSPDYISGVELNDSTIANGSSATLQILGASKDPSNNDVGSANVNWVVRINEHELDMNVNGV